MIKNIVFAHGLWADGSCFGKVIALLQAQGFETVSTQNPLTSCAEDVKAAKRAINRIEGKCLLVGHSYGGFVISEAGNDEKVAGLVYLAAFAPDKGETVQGLLEIAPPTKLGDYLQLADEFIWLSKDGIQNAFAQDLDSEEAALVYATQAPAHSSLFGTALENPAWKDKPSWYVLATDDQTINPEAQKIMSSRINAKVTEIDAGHVVMISHPEEVAKVIIEAAVSSDDSV